jgi:hypothetical protein
LQAYYALMGQPTIKYGKAVERMDALDAVTHYRPEVVVGSWITEWIDPALPPPPHGGSMYGVKEDQIVAQCDYILIGNIATHGKKSIMSLPHEEHALSFVRSRAVNAKLDRVWIWRRNELLRNTAHGGLPRN